MSEAKTGDIVHIHYTGTLADGETFDSSCDRDPLEFTLGSGQVIAGFDAAVTGMVPGAVIVVDIAAAQAYGPINPESRQSFPRDRMPPDISLEIGTRLQLQSQSGQPLMVTVSEMTADEVVLDGNHPLAGRDLTFEIELVEIASN
jgi:peptidylprolyl isomerase